MFEERHVLAHSILLAEIQLIRLVTYHLNNLILCNYQNSSEVTGPAQHVEVLGSNSDSGFFCNKRGWRAEICL